jgi:nuclear pore complex protein Nup54
LATKVQVLRNRGYALSGDEEDLKAKLIKIEKGASDPALGARAEEIWARMINVQERGRLLRTELEKVGQENGEVLDDTTNARCKKVPLYLPRYIDLILISQIRFWRTIKPS